ncbi:MAG: hypothetical protein M3P18_14485 [Actinomycetota bacterium]|nr:hypothetical protein [Actinomycetota bacterium]
MMQRTRNLATTPTPRGSRAFPIGWALLLVLAAAGVPSSWFLFESWMGASDFQSIIPGWPAVAAAGFVGSLAFFWGVLTSWRRPRYAVWTGAIGAAIGLALLVTAAIGFSLDFPGFLDLVVAPVIFPILMAIAGRDEGTRIVLVAIGSAFLVAGSLQIWALGRWVRES